MAFGKVDSVINHITNERKSITSVDLDKEYGKRGFAIGNTLQSLYGNDTSRNTSTSSTRKIELMQSLGPITKKELLSLVKVEDFINDSIIDDINSAKSSTIINDIISSGPYEVLSFIYNSIKPTQERKELETTIPYYLSFSKFEKVFIKDKIPSKGAYFTTYGILHFDGKGKWSYSESLQRGQDVNVDPLSFFYLKGII